MALAHKEYPHYGLQFHPESICTCYGNDLLRNFLRIALDYQLKNACRPFPLKGEIDQGSSTATTTPMSKRGGGRRGESKRARLPCPPRRRLRQLHLQRVPDALGLAVGRP
mmetsp:Transcript_4293/g.7397  ORF Transcript_4293/g.7397 Transcript_4293/m.7397 type:complete len:110 (+) Transcript_4293:707-1036(+)